MQFLLYIGLILAFWGMAARMGRTQVIPVALVTVSAIALAGFRAYRWWLAHAQSSVSFATLLGLAMVALALGLLAATDLLPRGIRYQQKIRPGEPHDPSAPRFLRTHSAPPWKPTTSGQRMSRFGAALLPVIALTTAAALVHTLTGPFLQVSTAISEDSLPARPTRMGSEIAWRRDVPNLLGVTAGWPSTPGTDRCAGPTPRLAAGHPARALHHAPGVVRQQCGVEHAQQRDHQP